MQAIEAAEVAEEAAEQDRQIAEKAMQNAAATLTAFMRQRDACRLLGVSFQMPVASAGAVRGLVLTPARDDPSAAGHWPAFSYA